MSNGTRQFAQEPPVIYLAFANPQGDLRGIAGEYKDIVDTFKIGEGKRYVIWAYNPSLGKSHLKLRIII
jgi:hypothetical protein